MIRIFAIDFLGNPEFKHREFSYWKSFPCVKKRWDDLPERSKTVLKMYYGIEGCPVLPVRDIASNLAVSAARVNQIRRRALSLMRRNIMRELRSEKGFADI